jgi:hypothetical protein
VGVVLLSTALFLGCLAGAASAADPPPALTDARREHLDELFARLLRRSRAHPALTDAQRLRGVWAGFRFSRRALW